MFELDMHTHTVASGHAYSTIMENARVAKNKGLKLLGMSDHSSAMPGGAHIFHFQNLRILPEIIEGVRVLKGVEANIIDYKGNLDLNIGVLENLEYTIASLHIPCISPGSRKDNTKAIIGAMKNPFVNIIGHPDDSRYENDFEEIVKAAKYYDKLLEVNNTSLNPKGFRQNAGDVIRHYLELCEKEQVKIICSSDAHIAYDVGNFANCTQIIESSGFPEELIINSSAKDFLKHINA